MIPQCEGSPKHIYWVTAASILLFLIFTCGITCVKSKTPLKVESKIIVIYGPQSDNCYRDSDGNLYYISVPGPESSDYIWPINTVDGDIWKYRGLYFYKGFDSIVVDSGTTIEDAAEALAKTRRPDGTFYISGKTIYTPGLP